MPPRSRPASLPNRLNWLRYCALFLGALVFLGHVITLKISLWAPPWWEMDWQDVPKHFGMLSAFSLSYRLSWRYPGSLLGSELPPVSQQRGRSTRALSARRKAAAERARAGLPGAAGSALARLRLWLSLWDVPGAGLRSVLVCSGWGAFCETLQIWHPYRDFSPLELGVNMLTPVLWASLVWLLTHSAD
ncbi:hypothetical protein IT575_02470 [bacterium]|nr:hypothetical protein [bacterium]